MTTRTEQKALPRFLVHTVDGTLHCYWGQDTLRIDLQTQPRGDVVGLFKRERRGFKDVYEPMAWEEVFPAKEVGSSNG